MTSAVQHQPWRRYIEELTWWRRRSLAGSILDLLYRRASALHNRIYIHILHLSEAATRFERRQATGVRKTRDWDAPCLNDLGGKVL